MQSMIAVTQTCNVDRGLPGNAGSPMLTITSRSPELSLRVDLLPDGLNLGRYIPHSEYLMHTIDAPDDCVELLDPKDLAKGWNAVPHIAVSQAIGDEWLRSRQALALRLPSVHSQSDTNILLNPEHPDIQHIRVLARSRYQLDRRLF